MLIWYIMKLHSSFKLFDLRQKLEVHTFHGQREYVHQKERIKFYFCIEYSLRMCS
jgi:hypothetical protein